MPRATPAGLSHGFVPGERREGLGLEPAEQNPCLIFRESSESEPAGVLTEACRCSDGLCFP